MVRNTPETQPRCMKTFTRKRETGTFAAVPDREVPLTARRADPVPAPAAPAPRKGNGEEFEVSDKATLKQVAKIAQRRAERDLIERILRQTRWNRRKAAQILDISYKALLYKIKDCGLNED